MKNELILLLLLSFLVNACIDDTTQYEQSSLNETKSTENKSTIEKEEIEDFEPQVLSDEQICIGVGGSWLYFPNTCVDSCTKARSKEPVLCGQAFTWGCKCGPNKCWNGTGCEPIIEEELLHPDNKTIEDNLPIGCGNFLSNEHVMFGYPSSERVLERQAYVLSHDDDKKVARWVSYHLKSEYLEGDAVRKDNFKPDPDIPKGKRAENNDYVGSGLDKGHIAPADDMKRSQSIMDESFFLSNMAPQNLSLNRGIWLTLENNVRDWAKKRGSIWIIAGPIFDDGHNTIGSNKVGVPQRFYKIIVSGKDCDFDSISFIFPNEKVQNTLESYITSIDEVESATGLDFLNVLEDTLEEKIESASAKELWNS